MKRTDRDWIETAHAVLREDLAARPAPDFLEKVRTRVAVERQARGRTGRATKLAITALAAAAVVVAGVALRVAPVPGKRIPEAAAQPPPAVPVPAPVPQPVVAAEAAPPATGPFRARQGTRRHPRPAADATQAALLRRFAAAVRHGGVDTTAIVNESMEVRPLAVPEIDIRPLAINQETSP